MQRRQILKEVTQLNFSKEGQSTDIPTKIIKQNSDIFDDFILTSFNQSVSHLALKTQILPRLLRKVIET